MADQSTDTHQDIRYEPDERPPLPLLLGLGFQYAVIAMASIMVTPAMMIQLAQGSEAYLSWAVFSALVIGGITTLVQVIRFGRFGSGYILLMGSTTAFLPVCVSALEQGGPGLLASLIIISSFFQFIMAGKLSLLRQIFTPTVAGTAMLLIPIMIGPLIMKKLVDVPEWASPAAAPATAAATVLAMVVVAIRGSGMLRLWAPIIGLGAGSITGVFFGIYDTARIPEAGWIGTPSVVWPGFDLSFGPHFWALLPAFVMITFVGALDTIGDTIAMQRASWRRPRAVDFRSIQGSLNADGLGNLLSGLAGTVPNTTYAASIAIAEITRVASRAVGVCVGGLFVVIAFLPKLIAVVLAIPSPVMAAYLIVIVSVLFVMGIRVLVQDGLDYQKGVIVGFSFWTGIAMQFGWIFPDYLHGTLGELLENGVTTGCGMVIVLTLFLRLTGSRPQRFKTTVHIEALPKLDTFLSEFAARKRCGPEWAAQLRAVGEEALLTFIQQKDDGKAGEERQMLLIARKNGRAIDLEFIVSANKANLEDQMAVLSEQAAEIPNEDELSLRMLQHHATSVRHQQFHDTDVVTVRVESAVS